MAFEDYVKMMKQDGIVTIDTVLRLPDEGRVIMLASIATRKNCTLVFEAENIILAPKEWSGMEALEITTLLTIFFQIHRDRTIIEKNRKAEELLKQEMPMPFIARLIDTGIVNASYERRFECSNCARAVYEDADITYDELMLAYRKCPYCNQPIIPMFKKARSDDMGRS